MTLTKIILLFDLFQRALGQLKRFLHRLLFSFSFNLFWRAPSHCVSKLVDQIYQNYLSRMVNLVLNNVPIEFPFQPYDVQEKFMERVIECLQKVTSVLLRYRLVETPCSYFVILD